ncbi:MAG TPA: bifunctional diaminohydroxyphosphoribosylaminopyrimidine deaminase/5-amino-6-(5-phosphoribosylamino)uracil reductase RibD, partial [Smithellaceae bacterium]|nr:bifunctional diaminohydroxyphosphoribosylaminopyrimidine deaminase/5-amino-6-(5-phosphoribosylamino)uracil reductase RibD [Smithellaceae bacterium]
AVIVKNGRIIGQGYHRRYGEPHAEINAIRNAATDLNGTTLYINLEPCCHSGKTPPCVDSIIEHKIGRVIIGATDSNPLVSGRGIAILRNHGIEVKTGVMENECRAINEVFFYYMEKGLPFVTLKYAQTLDGRIAAKTGQSQWISSEASLKFSHRLRAEHDAILVGSGTVSKDNPELTVRLVRGRNPLRVILSSDLRIPAEAKILHNLSDAPTLIATLKKSSDKKFQQLISLGAEVISVAADKSGKVDLKSLLKILAGRKISSVLLEGGAGIITSAFRDNIANRLVTIIAPKIIGKGIEAVGDLNIEKLASAKILVIKTIKRSGTDIIIDGRME